MTFEFKDVPISDIFEDNIRKHSSPERQSELGQSMDSAGQLQPVLLRPRAEGGYWIIDGHRRLKIKTARGDTHILSRIETEPVTDAEAIQKALISNIQHEAMAPFDIAKAVARYMKETGATVAQAATAIGMAPPNLFKHMAFLKLPTNLAQALSDKGFGASVAYELVRIDDPANQAHVAAKVLSGEVKRDTISAAAKVISQKSSPPRVGSRFSAPWSSGTITITGLADGSIDEVISSLEGILQRARRERSKGHSAKTLAKMLREEKGDIQ